LHTASEVSAENFHPVKFLLTQLSQSGIIAIAFGVMDLGRGGANCCIPPRWSGRPEGIAGLDCATEEDVVSLWRKPGINAETWLKGSILNVRVDIVLEVGKSAR
jgi:hypothetical protein